NGSFPVPANTPAPPPPSGGGGTPCIVPPLCGSQADSAMASVSSLLGGSPQPSAKPAANNLPAVKLWSVWNEPNLPVFLLPQRSSTKSHYPVSPTLYRNLYLAARNGLVATGHAQDTILMGELLPVGKSSHTPRSSIRPLDFLRELACV